MPFLRFTEPATNLGAVRLTGKLGMTVEADKTVTALPGGLTLCCSEAHALIEGVFVGDVTLGDNALPGNNQVSGSGTIKGSVIQFGGTFGSSKSISGSQVLKVVGNYRIIQPRAALLTEVFPDSAGRIEVAGTASLNGGLLFIAVDDKVKGAVPPFKVLTASGINGKFGSVIVYPPGSYAADVAYNAQDVTVTLRK